MRSCSSISNNFGFDPAQEKHIHIRSFKHDAHVKAYRQREAAIKAFIAAASASAGLAHRYIDIDRGMRFPESEPLSNRILTLIKRGLVALINSFTRSLDRFD